MARPGFRRLASRRLLGRRRDASEAGGRGCWRALLDGRAGRRRRLLRDQVSRSRRRSRRYHRQRLGRRYEMMKTRYAYVVAVALVSATATAQEWPKQKPISFVV